MIRAILLALLLTGCATQTTKPTESNRALLLHGCDQAIVVILDIEGRLNIDQVGGLSKKEFDRLHAVVDQVTDENQLLGDITQALRAAGFICPKSA